MIIEKDGITHVGGPDAITASLIAEGRIVQMPLPDDLKLSGVDQERESREQTRRAGKRG